MTNHESSETSAQAKKNEAVLLFLVRIVTKDGTIVVEDGLRFLKGDSMFPLIGSILALIPLKSQIGH